MINLQYLLEETKVRFGEIKVSKKYGTEYLAIPREKRIDSLRFLVNVAKNEGIEKEFFLSLASKVEISSAFFPDSLTVFWDKNKKIAAHRTVIRELNQVVAEFFPTIL